MQCVANSRRRWCPGDFTFVRTLQQAPRNRGRVDCMRGDGVYVAVKRLPNDWIRSGPKEFEELHPESNERPWYDIGVLQQLNAHGFQYCYSIIGLFCDEELTYIVTPLASEGDLYEWCARDPRPGRERERVMRPLAVQICAAVRWLHELGVVHRDISLENILLTVDSEGTQQIKIIDFGMATLCRSCDDGVNCKAIYQAPETHLQDAVVDGFRLDAFAVGVVLFAMALHDYPWWATRPGSCQQFRYYQKCGFEQFMRRHRLRNARGLSFLDVLSGRLARLLEGLLACRPGERLTLGESCWHMQDDSSPAPSVWDSRWMPRSARRPAGTGAAHGGLLQSTVDGALVQDRVPQGPESALPAACVCVKGHLLLPPRLPAGVAEAADFPVHEAAGG